MPKSVPFQQVLSSYLQAPEKAMSYLKSALEEEDPQLFQAALQDVLQVHGEAIALNAMLPKLVDSLQKHGVKDEVIQAVMTEISPAPEAA
jgi:DNA-binding phage protein